MCLSIPAKVISVQDDTAVVSVSGTTYKAGIQLLDGVREGDYVLLHAGFAIQVIDPKEAEETLSLLREMNRTEKK